MLKHTDSLKGNTKLLLNKKVDFNEPWKEYARKGLSYNAKTAFITGSTLSAYLQAICEEEKCV